MNLTRQTKTRWEIENISVILLKGLTSIFDWSGKPISHFQKQGKIHVYQNKQQNPLKLLKL